MERRSAVYSWRVTPALKASLEEAAARGGKRSVAALLEQIVTEHVAASEVGADAVTQRRLQVRVARLAGCIGGRSPDRASKAGALVRARLKRLRRAR